MICASEELCSLTVYSQIYFQNETIPTLGYVYRFNSEAARNLPQNLLEPEVELIPTSDDRGHRLYDAIFVPAIDRSAQKLML